ncbi:hypothetical protein ACHQM5_000165 [Ranunculus cassubicifolius]
MDEEEEEEEESSVPIHVEASKEKRRPPLKHVPGYNKRRKLLSLPRDDEELLRLMKRVPQGEPKKAYYPCSVCLAKNPNHNSATCPCLDEIPEDVVTLGPIFDTVCLGCGKIGDPPCCGKGTYATEKFCGACVNGGHWYWERMCPKDYVYSPSVRRLPGVEYEEVPVTKKVNGTEREVPGYFKMKEVNSGSSNQSSKTWKSLGKKIVRGVKKIAL